MRDLLIGLDLSRKQRGLEVALRDAIRAGRLAPGDAVPSSRGLAADLEVARSTVVAAYDQLVAEGYLLSRRGTLTRVTAGPWAPEEPPSPTARPDYRLDLIPGEPDASYFPRAAWLRCTRSVLTAAPDSVFGYGDPAGLVTLRAELAAYVNRTRHTVAAAASIVVVPGTASGLAQIARLLHRNGTRVLAVEDPGFPFHQPILRREGLELMPVPVDAEGIDVDALAATDASAVLVTPAHQYPMGIVMSSQRRASLVSWARATGAWIIEDDYDGEFRFDRQPLGAVQGLAPDRVVYLGTTSKTLGAGLRVGWMIVPPDLREPLAEQRGRDSDVSHVTQATLERFIADGHLDRHVRRMRAVYRTRRDGLLAALASALGDPDVRGVSAGLHVTVLLPGGLDEPAVVQRALQDHRLALWGLRQHYVGAHAADGLVLGYGRTPTNFHDSLARLTHVLQAVAS